jgi:hypothetical protein
MVEAVLRVFSESLVSCLVFRDERMKNPFDYIVSYSFINTNNLSFRIHKMFDDGKENLVVSCLVRYDAVYDCWNRACG